MRYSTAMIFPATVPRAELCLPLLLLCDRIAWCRTVEADDVSVADRASDHFTKLPFCQARTPAPLGMVRDSFLALVRDMRSPGGEFNARFGRLALAALGDSSAQPGEAATEILHLLRGRGIETTDLQHSEAVEAGLWQARLVLELGAIVDEEDEALRRQLAEIQARERAVFRSLRGDEAEEKDLPSALAVPRRENGASERMLRLRLQAWTRLYGAGDPAERRHDLLVTDQAAAWERLWETGRELGLAPPRTVATLPLPGIVVPPEAKDFLARAVAFRQEVAGALAGLEHTMEAAPGAVAPLGEAARARWSEALAIHFAPSIAQGLRITLVRCDGVDPLVLLRAAFDPAGERDRGPTAVPGACSCLALVEAVA